MDVFFADGATPKDLRFDDVEFIGVFFADEFPVVWIGEDFFGKRPKFIPSARLRLSVELWGGLGDLVVLGGCAGFALGCDVARGECCGLFSIGVVT